MDARKAAQPRSLGAAKTSGTPSRGAQTPSPRPPGENRGEQWSLDPADVRRHARLMRERERVGPLGKLLRYTAVVLLLAGAVTVYWNFDTLRGVSVDFSGFVDLVARRVKDTVARPDQGATQTEVVKETEVAGAAAASSLASSPPATEPVVPEPATAAGTPEPKSLPATTPPKASASPEPPLAAAAPEPPPGPEQFSFGLAKIEVSEAAASADILILRGGDMRRASSVTWWTTDGTATAGQDYANLGRVVVKFAAHEQNRGIHIPIIGDRIVEGPENFYVNLAPGDGAAGEPTERLQVVINDDD
jgi:hypothetical protein